MILSDNEDYLYALAQEEWFYREQYDNVIENSSESPSISVKTN